MVLSPFLSRRRISIRLVILPLLALAGLVAGAGPAVAQPFGGIFTLSNSNPGYVRVPQSSALNPTGAITIEMWITAPAQPTTVVCTSLIGKGFSSSYWVGICNASRTLRSYVKGTGSQVNGGTIPVGELTHIAVTSDGVTRRHYINGELVFTNPETVPGPLTTNTNELRIGSDFDFNVTPNASFSEVRLWNVVRTQAQIRAAINVRFTTPQPGLVAAWGFGAIDDLGGHNGTIVNHASALDLPVTLNCGVSNATTLCLDNRFSISAIFRTGPPGSAESQAMTVSCPNPSSGLFWFFDPNNWEVMVKSIDACALNNEFWIFTAATTNVFYRLTVYDVRAGAQKVYFNYQGPPAPAVTDTSAFATCP